MKDKLKKKSSHAFGKDVYLLGEDEDGTLYWLEAPSWDCSWYWGFGYVENYINNKSPSHAKDIACHQHISGFVGYTKDGTFVHNLYDSPRFKKTTFTENEGWQLSELFKQYYLLKEMAEFCYRGKPGCHVSVSPVDHGELKDWNKKINKEMIPRITSKIIEILTTENMEDENV